MTEPSPPEPRFSDEFRLAVSPSPADGDELGHVSNIVYLRFVQDAAKAHSRAVGLDHAAYAALGAVFVVRRHEIDYLAPAFAGDALVVTTWIEAWSAATSVRRTSIVREGQPIARATTLWAMVSTATGRPRRVPAEVREAFARKVT